MIAVTNVTALTDPYVPERAAASSLLSMFFRYRYEIIGIRRAKIKPSSKTLTTSEIKPFSCKLMPPLRPRASNS